MKKANLHSILYLIILVVVLVIIIGFLGSANILLNDKKMEQQCAADVRTAYMQSTSFGITNPFATSSVNLAEIRCTPKLVKIKGANEENIKRRIADEMLSCWNLFDRGRINLFSNDPGLQENYCIICSYLRFNKREQKIDNFLDFLMNNKPVPNDPLKPDSTYFTLFYGNGLEYEDNPEKFLEKNNEFSIDTSKDYMTLFTYWKTVGTESKVRNLQEGFFQGMFAGGTAATVMLVIGTVAGVATGGVGIIAVAAIGTGSALGIAKAVDAPWDTEKQWTAGIYLVPIDAGKVLQQGCTRLGQ